MAVVANARGNGPVDGSMRRTAPTLGGADEHHKGGGDDVGEEGVQQRVADGGLQTEEDGHQGDQVEHWVWGEREDLLTSYRKIMQVLPIAYCCSDCRRLLFRKRCREEEEEEV